MSNEREFSTMDTYLAGFMIWNGKIPRVTQERGGRVSFRFPLSEDIVNVRNAYLSGATVPANEFAMHVKHARSMIFTEKPKNTGFSRG